MSWVVHNSHDYNSAAVPDIDFNSPDILTDPASFYHPPSHELTNAHRVSGMVGDHRNRMLSDDSRWAKSASISAKMHERVNTGSASSLGFSSAGPLFCQWRITVAMGERIYLNFTYLDIFQQHLNEQKSVSGLALSRGSGQLSCSNDYVEVRDGYYSGSPLIGELN